MGSAKTLNIELKESNENTKAFFKRYKTKWCPW